MRRLTVKLMYRNRLNNGLEKGMKQKNTMVVCQDKNKGNVPIVLPCTLTSMRSCRWHSVDDNWRQWWQTREQFDNWHHPGKWICKSYHDSLGKEEYCGLMHNDSIQVSWFETRCDPHAKIVHGKMFNGGKDQLGSEYVQVWSQWGPSTMRYTFHWHVCKSLFHQRNIRGDNQVKTIFFGKRRGLVDSGFPSTSVQNNEKVEVPVRNNFDHLALL